MNDDRFERSADMRLVDLQRVRIGAPAPRFGWQRQASVDLPHGAPIEETPVERGPLLTATLDAQPRSGLIPGAVVTVSLAIMNDGTEPVAGLRAILPLPRGLRLASGSLRINDAERDDEVAEALLEAGVPLAALGPGERRTVVLRFAVDLGLDDITLAPYLQADAGAGIAGPRALRLTRGAKRSLEAFAQPERPFYELDTEEEALEPPAEVPGTGPAFAQAAEHYEPVLPPAPAPPPPAPPPPLTLPPAPPRTTALPAPPIRAALQPAPQAEPEPEPAPRGPVGTAHGGFVLQVTLDRKRHGSLAALFTGERRSGMIAHYLVLNALATRDPLDAQGDAAAIGAFLAAQERLLSKALITSRLGKTIIPENVAAALPPFPPEIPERSGRFELTPAPAGAVTLVRAFRPAEIAFIGRTLANESAHPFLRAAQFFVGLAPGDAALADAEARGQLAAALASYAAQAGAAISRIFLRAKLARSVSLFRESDPELDTAAKAVLAALEGALG